MKRFGNLYDKIYDMENLKLAHKRARENKTHYDEVRDVDKYEDYYLSELQQQLKNKTYRTSEYVIFNKIEGGKERVLYKLPYFPDRVCQWAIMNVIQPILLEKLVANTFSAIPNRGIHLANKKVKECLDNDPANTQYFVKMDIKKYYPSINKTILKNQYARIFKDKHLLWILNEIIDSTPEERGIPIGNFLSQWSGNLFLSPIDHWLKEQAKVKYVFRYMDDIILCAGTKEELACVEFGLVEQLGYIELQLKHQYQIHKVDERGIDFAGFRFFRGYTLLRKRTVRNMKRKVGKIKRKLKNKQPIYRSDVCSFFSYKGIIGWCDSYNLYSKHIHPIYPTMKRISKEV